MKKVFYWLAMSLVSLMALTLLSCSDNSEEDNTLTTPGYSWVVEDNHSSAPLPVTEKGEVALKENMDEGISIYVSDKDGAYLREDAYTIRVLNADKVDTHVIYFEKAQNWNNDPNPVISLFVRPVGGGETSVQVEIATKGDHPQVVLRRTFKFIVPGEKAEDPKEDDVETEGYSWRLKDNLIDDAVSISENGEIILKREDDWKHGFSFLVLNKDGFPLKEDACTIKVVNPDDVDTHVISYTKPDNWNNDKNPNAELLIQTHAPGKTDLRVEVTSKGDKPQVLLRRTFKIVVKRSDVYTLRFTDRYKKQDQGDVDAFVMHKSSDSYWGGDIQLLKDGRHTRNSDYSIVLRNIDDIDTSVLTCTEINEASDALIHLDAEKEGEVILDIECWTKEEAPRCVLNAKIKVIVTNAPDSATRKSEGGFY